MGISKINITLIFSLYIAFSSAQTVSDAVRYSNTNFAGTARTAGVGNSFGAMGGDFAVVGINPAGISDFRKSDFTFSFSFNNIENDAFLRGDESNVNTDRLGSRLFLENIAAVFAYNPRGKLTTSNLSVGLNQIANLSENIFYQGSTPGSITDRFVELGNGSSQSNGFRNPDFLDDFEAGPAFETGAIFPSPFNDLDYISDFIPEDIVNKRQSINRTGRINEFSVAWAGKIKNKLGIGVALGIPFISFEENKEYRELDPNDEIPFFESLDFNENLVTSGTGINLKLGVNGTVAKRLRWGLAWHSPTYYRLEDQYSTNMQYTFVDSNGSNSFTSQSPDGFFEYNYVAPMRFIASAGYLLRLGDQVRGFFNADVEFIDYRQNSFGLGDDSSEQAFENELNQQIDDQLQSDMNIKLGGELAYSHFRVRAGVNLLGNPYINDGSNSFDNIYAGGIGYRGDQFYIDVAYVTDRSTVEYTPYFVLDESRNQVVSNNSQRNKLLFTFGFKF